MTEISIYVNCISVKLIHVFRVLLRLGVLSKMKLKNVFSMMALVAIFCSLSLSAFGADETLVVTPVNPQDWVFGNDGHLATSSGSFVNGPGTPPAGTGSVSMSVIDTPLAVTSAQRSGHVFGTARYLGTRLADITQLKYSIYGSNPVQSIALQFDTDSDSTSASADYQRTVAEFYLTSTVAQNTWQEYDVMAGKVWGSGSPGPTRPITTACPQWNPCTWSYFVTAFPNAVVSGATLFKAGSGWPDFTGSIDKFTIGVNGNNTTWDFELYSTPIDPDQCKSGGYTTFSPSTGPFKNQGECIASVVSNAGGNK